MLENIPSGIGASVGTAGESWSLFGALELAIATSTSHKLESPGKSLSEGASTLGGYADYYS